MKKILMMLLVLLGLGMAACSLEGFGGGNNNKLEHKHSIVEGWKNDSANHWQLCDSCDEKINFGAHEFGEWTKVEGLDLEIRSCACGWEEQRNTTPTNKDLTVYYYNTQNWTEVAAYAWDSVETKVLGDWPGSLMIAESDGWYTITISATSLDDLKIIFNSHQAENASQTPDIELDSDYVYFYGLNTEGFASKEDAIAAYEEEQAVPVVPNTYYLRGSMNDWGTSAPLTVNGDVASIEIEILRTDEFKVACAEWSDKNFGITNGEVAVNGGNFKVEKSGLYRVSVINYGTEQETVTIELLEEFEDQVVKNDYYFRGKINAVDHWNTCDETVKFVAGETSATFEVTLAVGDEFKVAVAGAGWSPQFNANNATYEADHIGGSDNLVVKTAGRYKLEITGWGTAEEKLVITLVEASEVEPVEKVYEVEINGVKHTLVPNPDTAGEYQVLDVAVEAGQVVKVLVDGEEAAAVADAWTGNNLNAEMKIVNNATASIYVKPATNGWSVWVTGYVAPEVPDPELPEEKEEVTVYYYNSKQWNSVYSYVWDSSENKLLGAWPGSAMTAEAEGWYTIKIEAEALEGLNIIFNNNSGTQTADIALDVVNPYYYGINTTGFASKEAALEAYAAEQVSPNVYYLRGDMNNWDTSKPLTVNGDVASIEVHISKGQGFKVACASWDDKWFGDANGQNLTVEKSGLYLVSIINYGSENEELKIELVKEDEDQTPVEVVYYIVGGFNGWAVADANYVMVADSENAGFYVIKNVELTANQTLKVIEVSEGTIWNGYTNFKGDTNLNVSRDNDDNIVLVDAGTYNISFKPEGREIYITKVDTTGGEEPEEPVENIITLYFQNNWDWVDVKVHYWGNNVSTEWPGVAMQLLGKLDGKELYSVSFDANKYTGFIINGINPSWESGRDQTKDLSVADYLDVFAGNALYLVRDEAASNNTLGYYGFDMNNVDTHTCDFTGDWSYDKDNHWHTCSCGLTDEKVAHTMEENTCSVCGYTVPVEQPAKMITIYFQNNWLWTDVCAHYWGDNGGTEWPGVAMEKVGEVDGQELYAVEIDMNKYTHFIINGIKNDGSGSRDQTPDLVVADYEEVASYHCLYMVWNDGNGVDHFEFQHSFGKELSSDDLSHYETCVGCGAPNTKLIHTFVEGVCSECGHEALEEGFVSSNEEAIKIEEGLITLLADQENAADSLSGAYVNYYLSNVDLSKGIYVSFKYKANGITGFGLHVRGGKGTALYEGYVANMLGNWNVTVDTYESHGITIATAYIHTYVVNEYGMDSLCALGIKLVGNESATFEILDFAITEDGKHGFEIPQEVIEGPYKITAKNATEVDGVFTATSTRPELTITLAEPVAATNTYVSIKLSCSKIDNFDLYLTGTAADETLSEEFSGSKVLDITSPAWNQTVENYQDIVIVTLAVSSFVGNFATIDKARLYFRTYENETIEILDFAITADGKHGFEIPEIEIEGKYLITATSAKVEGNKVTLAGTRSDITVAIPEKIDATNCFITFKLAYTNVDSFDINFTGSNAEGAASEVAGSYKVLTSSAEWNTTVVTGESYIIVTANYSSHVADNSFVTIDAFRLYIRGYEGSTVEVLDLVFTADGNHQLQ